MNLTNKNNQRILSVTLTGPMHIQKGMSCQDFCFYKSNKKRKVAVVSDGAGTAKFGKIGAKNVCLTLCDILMNSNLKNPKEDVIFALEAAREKLMNHRYNSSKSEEDLINFAATVIGVIYENGKGLFFHIGDGAGIAFFDYELKKYKISKPENGIFSCETYFYTMDDWKDSLRFSTFENAKQVCLMTDGITGFAFKNDFNVLESRFMAPVLKFLNEENNPKKAKKALTNTLCSSQAKKICSDDKTFLWMRL